MTAPAHDLPRPPATRRGPTPATFPAAVGAVSLAFLGALLVCDATSRRVFGRAHDALAAVSLALVAAAWLAHQARRRAAWRDWVRAAIVAVAFFLWALNQVWPDPAQAVLLNDAAIAAFVADVFLALVEWPGSAPPVAPEPPVT